MQNTRECDGCFLLPPINDDNTGRQDKCSNERRVANTNKRERMETKTKSFAVNGDIKHKSVDGERRITFVASSDKQDRHGEFVDTKSLRLPLKGGGYIKAENIPAEGFENIDIPLMLNHSADIRDVIGSVRRAYFENGELIFEAGLSTTELAKEITTLVDEGHLSNAFSITMIDFDYDYDSETIYGAEVIEVSVVYRGANREARLLAVKSLGETPMEEEQKESTEIEVTVEEPTESTKDAEPTEAQSDTEVEEPTVEEPVEETEPAETEADDKETVEETNKEKEMDKEIAKDAIVEKSATAVVKENGYLESKKALADFRDIVLSHYRGSNIEIMKAWKENIASKGITGDAIMPARVEQIFFKAWVDNTDIISTFRQLNARAGAVYAMAGGTNGAAKGHKKGEEKIDQDIVATRRDLKALAIYKKLPIDLQDLFDDETGELLAFRVEELASRIAHAIAVGAIMGDSTNKYLIDGRGLNPMVTDINAVSGFGSKVATKVTVANDATPYACAVKALSAVKSDRKVLIVPDGWKSDMLLATDKNGALLLPIGMSLEQVLNCRIFELDELTGFEAIAYADQSYVLVGEPTATVRTDFDINYNQDVMLVERYVGGSATGYHTVAGVVKSSS